MGRQLHKLSALSIARKNKPGVYGDGGNLYLQVEAANAILPPSGPAARN